MTYKLILCCLAGYFISNSLGEGEEFGPQPRIISSAGHLIFNAADNKNIKFITKGKGKIFLNQGDLTEAAALARNASDTLLRINSDYYNTHFHIQRLKRLIEGPDGILDKMNLIDSSIRPTGNTSSVNTPTNRFSDYSLSLINRRIRMLQRKVNRLILLLTKDECTSNPCKNGGTCQDIFNGFICKCPPEWEGPTCDRDVNECSRYAGTDLGCQNGATCINKPGSYECHCAQGWFGIHCTRQSTSCTSGSVEELCGHGTCIPQSNSAGYKCLCDQGWTTEGTNLACTKDVDECTSTKPPPCSTNPPVPCINVPGTFYCGSCPRGYTGNGYYCVDLDECVLFNGGCSMNPLVQCINTPGSSTCGSCPPGYVGNGQSCTFQGVCGVNNGGCHHFAQCRDNPRISSTYVECVCPAGYIGSGIGPSGCVRVSEGTDPCASNPCVHGTCLSNNLTGTYSCLCNRKYTGKNCDIRKDPCQPNPCANGGTCRTIADISYRCSCSSSYTGHNCEQERQACGGRLSQESGTLKYPADRSTVSTHLISCAWIIETNHTKVINITFTEFHLDGSNNCRYDWLQIHDGRNSASTSLGRFCGSAFPLNGTVISTHNAMYLWFRSDPTVSRSGFELKWNSIDPVCGGYVSTTSHGTIHSPGFPGNYPPNRDCYWNIEATIGKRLQFHFFSLTLGNSANCTDYVTFSQGHEFARYCNTSHPEPLYSSGPSVDVHFHSGPRSSNPGFQIAYSVTEGMPGCGGIYTSNAGEISSPTIDGGYPPDIVCEYKIKVLEKSRVRLTFMSFDLEEEEESCSYDYLEVHEGSSVNSPLIGKYCGKTLPPPYTSIANEVFLVFTSDWGNNEKGFRLKYESVCGGIYTEPEGVIESPGYPNFYAEDQLCVYEIVQPLGATISLTFTDFELEATAFPECMFDFVEIRDGDNDNSTLVGQYCEETPPDVQSTFNYLWIKFQSDSSIGTKGFRAKYTTTNVGCGGILKSNAGVIKSPEHPEFYPSSSVCTWIVVAPPGSIIQLSWIMFRLEQSSSCSFDYVEVYNNDTQSESIGKFCGTTLPPTLISSSNMLTLKFVTDSSINFDGFVASYNFMDEETACGGRYFTSYGVIKSPFYPRDYPINRECTWVITVQHGQQILLNVSDFSMESFTNCNYDHLEIRNGGTASSPLIGKYCGTDIPKQIPSHANQLFLAFKSDMSHTSRGFKLTWESTATGCGGTLTAPRGTIISPFYPEPYNRNTDCFWRISISAGSIIQLIFADLDLEDHMNCGMDYVEIFDGPDTLSKSLGKFCYTVNVPYIRSSSNHLAVLFRSDSSFQKRGFHLQYSTVCQNNIKGFRGVIESPNFPDGYPQDQDCRWRIEVPQGNKINITFSHFELERSTAHDTNCSFDYLMIKYKADFYEEDDNLVFYGNYCGSTLPPLIPINSNIAEVRFVTDDLLIGSGFRLEWHINGCGGKLTRPFGTISTPNYPNGYSTNTDCEWTIQVDYGYSINMTFEHVDLEISYNCMFDFVLVANGLDDTYPTLTKICSAGTKPIVVTSTGNLMFVKFHSDNSYRGRGFIANYTSIPSKCGGKLTAPSGSIHSPNYPKNYNLMDVCEWLIDIDDTYIIELIFDDLDLAGECDIDYVKIYDGPTAAYPVLATGCGKVAPNMTVRSSYNQVLVEMRTADQYTAKGFMVNYTITCGARIVTQNSGIIKTNHLSSFNETTNICSWTIISSDPSEHVSLAITHMEGIECYESEYYETEYQVKIYNGESTESPLLAKYCGKKLPPVLTSSGNALHIEVDKNTVNFVARYSILDTACGGTLTGTQGAFTTPKYPDPYPSETQCEWTITVAPGNKITVSFQEFELISSENCNLDYLEIRSENSAGKLLGTFCNDIPSNITKVGSLWLLFKSSKSTGVDSSFGGKGFLAEYTIIHGTELTGPSGQIASPLYPDYCVDPNTFTWKISVEFGKRISLTFLDFFIEGATEEDSYGVGLEIYDGFDENAPQLVTLLGATNPDPVKSSSNLLFLRMYCTSYGHGSKFLLEWLEIDGEIKFPTFHKKSNDCNSEQIIDMSNKSFYQLVSPGYPNGYAQNLECNWIFSTPPEYHLSVEFVKLDVENIAGQCILDTVTVYNGKNEGQNWEKIATVCFPNVSRNDEISTSNLMKITFKSDNYMNGTGFDASIKKQCGGSITGSNGVISVNMSDYMYSSECQWNVTVRPGRKIQVKLLQLNVQSTGKGEICPSFLMLKNGHYATSPILGIGKYCDNTIPETLQTTGNQLWIKFIGEFGKGFELSYEEMSFGCDSKIALSKSTNESYISTPNYPNIPPPYAECFWLITAPPGEALRVDFEERFDITYSDDCSLAAVEIRDGGSKHSPLLGAFCNEIPNSTFSSDNMMYIRFFTNVEEPSNGFKAVVSIASCGGVIRSGIGEVHSPNFNNKKMFPKNSDCIWRIIGPTDHYLTLKDVT